MKTNPLLDKDFLKALDEHREKETYAKIIALTYQEDPIEEITGRVTGGSVSINGTSAIRRTCSLNMIAQDLDINDYYWGEKNKFRLFIGLKNKIDKRYPDIIWFPQGTFVISNFSSSLSSGSFDISIQGRDKMCLLNGEIGGMVHSLTVDFGSYDQIDEEGNKTNIQMIIRDIIKSMVHEYGKEPYHNIVINDLEDTGVELMEYRGDNPLYLLVDYFKDEVTNMTLNGKQPYQLVEEVSDDGIVLKTKAGNPVHLDSIESYDMRAQLDMSGTSRPPVTLIAAPDFEDGDPRKIPYSVMAIQYGETIGYRVTDLTYAGDLIANVGESITSVLDKIVNMLGDFEYFYDIDGRFIFQKKPTFIYTSWNNITRIEDEEYVDNAAYSSACSYHFENNNLISSFSNNPDLANVRNDFSIWGTRKGVSGDEIPVHLRYAIDKKPEYYKNFKGQMFVSNQALYDKLLYNIKTIVEEEVRKEMGEFSFRYINDYRIPLEKPVLLDNGTYSPGWWDIRDWHDYYKALTGEEPRGTMKWYSSNDLNGCTPLQTLPGYENDTSSSYVWLIIVNEKGDINTQHGAGNPHTGKPSLCTYYESYLDEETGRVVTQRSEPLIQEYFIRPYAGCTDTHTYLQFLKDDVEQGRMVYFYSPQFPDMAIDKIKDKMETQIKEYQEMLNLVDWREIIYQMALDYYKYAHNTDFDKGLLEDEFLSKVRNNNIDYYPTGYTGYEQYYQDLQGFWRQLYNPWPKYEIEFTSSVELANSETPPDKVLIENAFRPFEKYMIDSSKKDLELSEKLYYRLAEYNQDYVDAGLIKIEEDLITGKISYKIKDEECLEALIKDEIPGKDYNASYYSYYIYQNDQYGKNMALWYDTLKIYDAYNSAKKITKEHFVKELYYLDESQTKYKGDLATCYDYPYFKIIPTRNDIDLKVEDHYSWEIDHLPSYIEKCDLYLKKLELTSEAQAEIKVNKDAWDEALKEIDNTTYTDEALKEDAKKRCNATYQKAQKAIEDKYTDWIPWFEDQIPPNEIFIKDTDGDIIECSKLPEKIQKLYYTSENGYSENILVRNYDRMGEILVETTRIIQYVQALDKDGKPIFNDDGEPVMTAKLKDVPIPDTNPIEYRKELDFAEISEIVYDKYPTTFYRYYYNFNTSGSWDNLYWEKEVTLYPENLNFWFDFLDISGGELAQFAVNVIGDRPKAVNDSSVKAIYFRETPTIILVSSTEWDTPREEKTGYTYINLPPELEGMFSISAQGKSAKTMLDQFLFDYAYCAETISISSIPIYYLEPNTRIFVRDDNSKINGEYIISNINLPLTYNGTMSISATKATQNIY